MKIHEVEVKTFAKTVACDCGGLTKRGRTDYKKEMPTVEFECLTCGKKGEIDIDKLDFRYEIIK